MCTVPTNVPPGRDESSAGFQRYKRPGGFLQMCAVDGGNWYTDEPHKDFSGFLEKLEISLFLQMSAVNWANWCIEGRNGPVWILRDARDLMVSPEMCCSRANWSTDGKHLASRGFAEILEVWWFLQIFVISRAKWYTDGRVRAFREFAEILEVWWCLQMRAVY